ncbi:UMP kinase [bacterium]|nr:UMP kinase [bacterium]
MTAAPSRVLLKLSGEALMGPASYGLDAGTLTRVAGEIRDAMETGVQVALVIGGGNVFRGFEASARGMDRGLADTIGMLATVMNAIAMADALKRLGLSARAMSAFEMPRACETYIRERAVAHLEKGRVVLLAGGTGWPYFTTDTAAALRACELSCDVLHKGTKVDGVYDADPVKNPGAKLYDELTYDEVITRGLSVMDQTAVSLCSTNRVAIGVFNMTVEGNIRRALTGEAPGTVIRSKA